jgi:N-acetylglutamate synthase-like GNAT family acetyltransferase
MDARPQGPAAGPQREAPRIRPLVPGEEDACEAILRALPEWFGIEESIVQYRKDMDGMETLVAEAGGRVVGFITLNTHNPRAAEIHILGIRKEHQRRGTGRNLVRRAEALLRERAVEVLQVKTLGPSREDASYAETRAFYEAVGFCPLEETNLWGDVNPCLIFVKHLTCTEERTP